MNKIATIMRTNLTLTLISAAAFALSIPAGSLCYPLVKDKLPALLKIAFAGVMTGTTAEIIAKVLLRNMTASLIILVTGVTVIIPVLILSANGFLVGLILRFALDRGLDPANLVYGITPHGIFELPALFICAAAGMRVGLQAVKSKGTRVKATTQAMKEASAVYLTTVIPLLIIAAVVEILVSRSLLY
ncbi:MAG: stage II sporulation protein M [Candidatus Altiarchaeota archaeon]